MQSIKLYEKMEVRNGKLTIDEIEAHQLKDSNTATSSRAKFILSLFYLKRTSRYKENPTYRQATFGDYIMGMYNLRKGTFYNESTSITNFPEESQRYGTGLISSIKTKCGANKMRIVVNEINAKETNAKKPLTHDIVEEIIERHKKPKAAVTDPTNTVTFWKNKCGVLEVQLITLKKENAELKAQVERQKPIVEAAMAVRASFSKDEVRTEQ